MFNCNIFFTSEKFKDEYESKEAAVDQIANAMWSIMKKLWDLQVSHI